MSLRLYDGTIPAGGTVTIFDLTCAAHEEWRIARLVAEHEGHGALVIDGFVTVDGIRARAFVLSTDLAFSTCDVGLALDEGDRLEMIASTVHHPEPCPLKAVLSYSRTKF